ncbi:hypothetical protein [Kribbella speibonae]|uniref:Uncharacterized protein n=1 Tax=Kribbella speibonae TaxID=1572660 RepID=A0A4R0J852_9ACTN|nr:hypothetical protein [Kribbella speibonae]TCC41860.1 hypothetical protein E0H92_09550 [Kribbella speibonae]
MLRVDAGTALVLREAHHKMQALPRGNHYALYDYVRGVVAKVAPMDTFLVGSCRDRIGCDIRTGTRTASTTTTRSVRSSGSPERLGVILRKYGMESRVQVAHYVRRYLAR